MSVLRIPDGPLHIHNVFMEASLGTENVFGARPSLLFECCSCLPEALAWSSTRLVMDPNNVADSRFPSQILDPYIRFLSPALYSSAIWRDADIKYV